jgi:hypothetical protein
VLEAPDGFRIWGIPSGARSVLSSLAPGDYLLLLESPGPGGTFVYGGRIIAAPTRECFDLSMHLWGEQRFPLIVFMTGRLTNYRWVTFCEALGYKPNWNPAGNTYRVTDERLAESTFADQGTLIRHVVGTHLGPVSGARFSIDLLQDPAEELIETEEGRRVLRLHLLRERSLALVRSFKRVHSRTFAARYAAPTSSRCTARSAETSSSSHATPDRRRAQRTPCGGGPHSERAGVIQVGEGSTLRLLSLGQETADPITHRRRATSPNRRITEKLIAQWSHAISFPFVTSKFMHESVLKYPSGEIHGWVELP